MQTKVKNKKVPHSSGKPLQLMPCYSRRAQELKITSSLDFFNRDKTPPKRVSRNTGLKSSNNKVWKTVKSETKQQSDLKLKLNKTPTRCGVSEFNAQEILEENNALKSQILELQNVIVSMCVLNQRQTYSHFDSNKNSTSISRNENTTLSLERSTGNSRPHSALGFSGSKSPQLLTHDGALDLNFHAQHARPAASTEQPNIFEGISADWPQQQPAIGEGLLISEISTEHDSGKPNTNDGSGLNADLSGISMNKSSVTQSMDLRNKPEKLPAATPSKMFQTIQAVSKPVKQKPFVSKQFRSNSKDKKSESSSVHKQKKQLKKQLTNNTLHTASKKSADFTPIVSAAQQIEVNDLYPTLRGFNLMPQTVENKLSPKVALKDKPYKLKSKSASKSVTRNNQKQKQFYQTMELPRKKKLKPPVPTVNRAPRRKSAERDNLNQTLTLANQLKKQLSAVKQSQSQSRTQLFNMTMDRINSETHKRFETKECDSRKSSTSQTSSFKLNKSFGSNSRHVSVLGSKNVSDQKPYFSKPVLLGNKVNQFDSVKQTPSPTPAVAKLPTQPSPNKVSQFSDSAQPAAVVAAELSLLGLTGKIDPIHQTADFDSQIKTIQTAEEAEELAMLQQIKESSDGPLHTGPSTLLGSSPPKSFMSSNMSPGKGYSALKSVLKSHHKKAASSPPKMSQQRVVVPRLALDKMNLMGNTQPARPIKHDTKPNSGTESCIQKITKESLKGKRTPSNYTGSPDGGKAVFKITEDSQEAINVFASCDYADVEGEGNTAVKTSPVIKMQKVHSHMSSLMKIESSTPTIQQVDSHAYLTKNSDTIQLIQPSPCKVAPEAAKAPTKPTSVENATKILRKNTKKQNVSLNRRWNVTSKVVQKKPNPVVKGPKLASNKVLSTSQIQRRTPTKTRPVSSTSGNKRACSAVPRNDISITTPQISRNFKDMKCLTSATPVSNKKVSKASQSVKRERSTSAFSRQSSTKKTLVKSKKNLLNLLNAHAYDSNEASTKDVDSKSFNIDLQSSNSKLSSKLFKPVLSRQSKLRASATAFNAVERLKESEKIREQQSQQLLDAQKQIEKLKYEMLLQSQSYSNQSLKKPKRRRNPSIHEYSSLPQNVNQDKSSLSNLKQAINSNLYQSKGRNQGVVKKHSKDNSDLCNLVDVQQLKRHQTHQIPCKRKISQVKLKQK